MRARAHMHPMHICAGEQANINAYARTQIRTFFSHGYVLLMAAVEFDVRA